MQPTDQPSEVRKEEHSMATKADEHRAKAEECTKHEKKARTTTMAVVYRDAARMWLRLAAQADIRSAPGALTAVSTKS
jgi:hypothetical protein